MGMAMVGYRIYKEECGGLLTKEQFDSILGHDPTQQERSDAEAILRNKRPGIKGSITLSIVIAKILFLGESIPKMESFKEKNLGVSRGAERIDSSWVISEAFRMLGKNAEVQNKY